jgi:hypothetical protein
MKKVMQMKNKTRIGWLILITVLLSCSAVLAAEAPPLIPGDGNVDFRYPFGWAPRTGHATVYDAARQRVVVYGGTTSDRVCPTVEWDGAYWKGIWTTNVPPVTTGHAMAYDAARGVTVLFGGGNALAETWLYDGTNWTRATPAVSPPGRAQHAMAYDSVSQRVLLYGGTSCPGQTGFDDSYLKDFWAWNGVNWAQLGGVPADMPALRGHAMACDTNRGVTVLYGGTQYGFFNNTWRTWPHTNTWEWSGTTWTNRNLSLGAVPNTLAMTYDGDGKRILVAAYVGLTGSQLRLYAYDGTAWVKTNEVATGGGANWGPIAYDAARHEAVVVPAAASDALIVNSAAWRYRGTNWLAGGFYPSGNGASGSQPLLFGDINGDNRPDMLMQGYLPNVSSNGYSVGVALFTNSPSGFDYRPVSLALIPGQTVARGDMNGDGLPELALGCRYGYVSGPNLWVLAGGSNGTFASTSSWSQTVSTWQVLELAWPDVNRDGRADLAVLYGDPTGSGTKPCGVAVYTNNGTTLATNLAVKLVFNNMAANYGCMAWEDVNRDGFVDLALAMQSQSNGVPDTVRVYTNNGAGNLAAATVLGGYAGAIRFADLNGDWWPDIVGPLFAYTNHLGSFGPELAWNARDLTSGQFSKFAIDTGDVDGDGDPDVAVFLQGSWSGDNSEALVYRNDAGRLTELPAWSAAVKSESASGGALGDADGDGDLDVATQRGIFLLEPLWHSSPLPLSAPMWLRAGVNPADRTTALVEWDPVPGPDVGGYRLYNGTTLITELSATQTQFVATSNLAGSIVYAATVDKAGREYGYSGPVALGSLKAVNSTADSASDFWWTPYVQFVGLSPSAQFVGDLDGDGDLDLFVATTAQHPVLDNNRTRWLVYTNNGTGDFGPAWEWRQSEDAADLHGPGRVAPLSLGDINGDGLPDLVGAASRVIVNTNTSLPETRWVLDAYTNSGAGFAADTNWSALMPVGHTPDKMTWGDADGNGRQDLVVRSAAGRAFLFLNHDGRLDSAPAWTSSVSSVSFVSFGVLDNDGKADLAVCTNKMGAAVYKGVAEGLAATPAWSDSQGSIAGTPTALTWADFDGDGDQDLTVHGYDNAALRNHPAVLYRNNGGALTYLCVYKARDYKDGAGVGIGGSGSFTTGWADMDHDGDLDLWGRDLILGAATPHFNAGPIGAQPTYWYGHANEEGLGYHPPWTDVQGVYDFNGDGTPDDLLTGSLMLRTPNSIYQADYVPYVPDLSTTNLETGVLKLYPSGTLVLDGPGAIQAIDVVVVQTNLTEVPVPYTPDLLSISLAGNPSYGTPYATVSSNVLTAVRDGTVTLSVKYGAIYKGSYSYIEATKTVRIVNAPWLPDILEVTPSRVTLARIGEAATLTASRQYPDGRIVDVTADCTWQVSDAGVVNMAGEVAIARGNGAADVVASYQGMSATCRVTVAATVGLSGLSLHPPEVSLTVGDYRGFEVRAHFSDGSVQPVTFISPLASLDPGIAAIAGSGVQGVSPGFADVTAAYLGLSAPARVAVTPLAGGETWFEITGFERQGESHILDWYTPPSSIATNRFTVYACTNLTANAWTPVASNVYPNPTGFNTITLPSDTNAPALFHRIGR